MIEVLIIDDINPAYSSENGWKSVQLQNWFEQWNFLCDTTVQILHCTYRKKSLLICYEHNKKLKSIMALLVKFQLNNT